MAPRGSHRRPLSTADVRAYLAKADEWFAAAMENLEAGRWDVAAGSAVTAGINACDAISGALLGQRSGGDHADTVEFLKMGGEEGRGAARQLAQLLRYKSPAQYDPAPISRSDARKAVDVAGRLVDRGRRVVERRR